MEKQQNENWFTIFHPGDEYPIKCRTFADVKDWFDLYWHYDVLLDENDPETWEIEIGTFIEHNDGSHMDPELWENLETHERPGRRS